MAKVVDTSKRTSNLPSTKVTNIRGSSGMSNATNGAGRKGQTPKK